MSVRLTCERHRIVLVSAVLAVLVLAAFEPVRHNDFVSYDDPDYITQNPPVQSGITIHSVKWAFTSGYAANWHPLTWLSHMLDIELFGLNPLGHHLHNLGLHIAATLLLFWVLQAMTGAVWCSAFAALAFGVHPSHVESVVWAAERKDVLCALFWMLTIAAYVSYARRGGVLRYLLALLCFALGLMAKPMIVTLPIVLLALDFWPLGRLSEGRCDQPAGEAPCSMYRPASRRRLIVEKAPFFLLALASCIITFAVQRKGGAVAEMDVGLALRVSNALVNYAGYVYKTVWPVHLAIEYPFPVNGWPAWKPSASFLLLAGVSGAALYSARKRPYLLTGWIWYVVTLIPVIGLVQVGSQAMADRYTYLPSIGLFMPLSWGVAQLSARWRYRTTIVAMLSGLAAVAMIAGTRAQVSHWKDSISLFNHTLSVTRNNYLVHRYLGTALEQQGRFAEAEQQYRESIRSYPDFAEAHFCLGQLLEIQKKYADAMQCFVRAIHLDPDDFRPVYKMGVVKAQQGLLADAEACFRMSIEMNPDFAKAHLDLGVVLQAQGRTNEAVGQFQNALKISPDDAKAWSHLGDSLQQQGRFREAMDAYQRSLKLAPGDASVYCGLAQVLRQQGRLSEAVSHHRSALKIRPDFAPSLNNLAWILATTQDRQIRNPSEAVRLAEQVCKLTSFKDENCLDTLAAAYAGASQFDKAIDTARKAITLAKAANHTETAEDIAKKLQLYQAGQAYLEP